jgi:hypothetical protein
VYRTHRLIRTTHIFKYINSTSVTIAVICTVYIFPYITIPLQNQTVQRTHIHTIHERNRILQGFRIRGGNKGYEQGKRTICRDMNVRTTHVFLLCLIRVTEDPYVLRSKSRTSFRLVQTPGSSHIGVKLDSTSRPHL